MEKMKWTFGFVAAFFAALALTTVTTAVPPASPAGQPSANAAVKIDNFSFGPSEITVPAGTTVTWTNRDDVPHVIASEDKEFKSKALDTDDQFSFTFAKPGTHNYYCAIHPKMTAKIVVQ